MLRSIARIDSLRDAEQIDRETPSALYEERARYHSALGMAELAASDRAGLLSGDRFPATI